MTTPPDPLDRIRRQLQDASTRVRLAPGSELDAVRAAHRRRNRGRALVGAAAVVAVGGGTVVAVQQLGKTSAGTFGVGSGDGGTPDHAVAPTSPVGATTTTVVGGVPQVDVRPAEPVAPAYSWNPVSVDAANAVFGSWQGSVPGVILATAPGVAADPNAIPAQQAYYTEDGVTFEPLDVDLRGSFGPGSTAYADGDSIYRVGTLPGVAPTDPNGLLAEVSTDRGATWDTIELPIDTNELKALPYLASGHSMSLGSSPAGPVVVVNRFASIDLRDLDLGRMSYYSMDADGVTVTEGACDDSPVATTTPAGPDAPSVVAVGTVAIPDATTPFGDAAGDCTRTRYTFEELGIPAESVEAARTGDGTSWAFLVADGQAVSLPLPDGATQISASAGGYFSAGTPEADWNLYTLTADRTWQRVDQPGPLGLSGELTATSATHTFGLSYLPSGTGQVIVSNDGSGWEYTSLAGLYGEFDQPESYTLAATPDGLAVGVNVRTDLVAQQGGISVTAGSVTIARADGNSEIEAVDAATGDPISGTMIEWDRPDGGVTVRGADGAVLGELTGEQFAVFNAWDEQPEWAIVTTADGVHVASERIADLLGVTDADIAGIRVNAVDRQVIVAVAMRNEVGPGVHEQRVLIGTPNE